MRIWVVCVFICFAASGGETRPSYDFSSDSKSLTVHESASSSLSFSLTPSSVMAPGLAARYPELLTFSGQSAQTRGAFVVRNGEVSGFYLSQGKLIGVGRSHVSSKQASGDKGKWTETLLRPGGVKPVAAMGKASSSPRLLRLALSATAEYSQYHGGTKSLVLAEMINLVNGLNLIFWRDLGVRFQLVDNTDALIFLDANSDPYNGELNAMLSVNQSVTDNVIGSDNYDIGHLLARHGGGIANIAVACNPVFKASGVSGLYQPEGQVFLVDILAHELGHMLAAEHSFNSQQASCGGNRIGVSAVEAGSGASIMSYAGLCGSANLQALASPYFHAHSLKQMSGYLNAYTANQCGQEIQTSNQPPVVDAGKDGIVPANTAILLQGQASDPDGDSLSYSWEQLDVGSATTNLADYWDDGTRTLYRPLEPLSQNWRALPSLSSLANDRVQAPHQIWHSNIRRLNFALVVRDGKGALVRDDMAIQVVGDAQGFSFSSSDLQAFYRGGETALIRWQVGDTATAPFHCAKVSLWLYDDSLQPIIALANGVANSGELGLSIPNMNLAKGYMMLRCDSQPFFALSAAFSIGSNGLIPWIRGQNLVVTQEDQPYSVQMADLNIDWPQGSHSQGYHLNVLENPGYQVRGTEVVPEKDFFGELAVRVQIQDGVSFSNIYVLNLEVMPVDDAPVANDDSFELPKNLSAHILSVLENDEDPDGDPLTLERVEPGANSASVSIENQVIVYQAAAGASQDSLVYWVSDGQHSVSARVNVTLGEAAAKGEDKGSSGGAQLWLLVLSLLIASARSRIAGR